MNDQDDSYTLAPAPELRVRKREEGALADNPISLNEAWSQRIAEIQRSQTVVSTEPVESSLTGGRWWPTMEELYNAGCHTDCHYNRHTKCWLGTTDGKCPRWSDVHPHRHALKRPDDV